MADIEKMLEGLRSLKAVDVEFGTTDAVQEMAHLQNVRITCSDASTLSSISTSFTGKHLVIVSRNSY